MSLEQEIVEWSHGRPPWQRMVLKKVAAGAAFTAADYDRLTQELISSKDMADSSFRLEHFPETKAGDVPVSLVSIAQPQHVNALESDLPLTFEFTGLNIVYGDNASGKSGYARLLKRIARSRHQEEVLTDVFRDSGLAKPQAAVTVKVGDKDKSLLWPEEPIPELQRMLFYDQACGGLYITAESDFPYRPQALFIMEGLIDACVALRNRIDLKLDENALARQALPAINEELKHTEIGRYLSGLSGNSSLQNLDQILTKANQGNEEISRLQSEENRLRSADTANEKQSLVRTAGKIDAVTSHFTTLESVLSNDSILQMSDERACLGALEQAADLLAKEFAVEPLPGVGTSSWKELWESARRYSEITAYPSREFPVTEDASCLLCQQPLQAEAQARLSRFERFVQGDTVKKLQEARRSWDEHVRVLRALTMPEAVSTHLQDLEPEFPSIVADVQALISEFEATHLSLIRAIDDGSEFSPSKTVATEMIARLKTAALTTRNAAERLSDPKQLEQQIKSVVVARKELELIEIVKMQRQLIVDEIKRLKKRDHLEAIKSSAATGPITKKILELSEESITEVVRDTFTRESDRLNLERVTMAMTRGERGSILHQPKLVGARQSVALPRIFSEGERTALGLAAFLTEAHLDASKSALILDDPVTSLDHIRRASVASRLASLAESRQVIIFTHDISFVADLKREVKGLGVPLWERSVRRGRGAEKKPGSCSTNHPWKARDVSERLGDLRRELARLRRESSSWDETTYENEVATWAGNLSETWERIFSQEIVGQLLADGGLEVRPNMVKLLVHFSATDEREFQASYGRVSQWAKRHDKSGLVNYVPPTVDTLQEELDHVDQWFKRVKAYKN